MGRSVLLVLLVAGSAGGWFMLQRYELHGLKNLELIRRDGTSTGVDSLGADAPGKNTIRIASLSLQSFGPSKTASPPVMEVLGRIIREFDLVALQEIDSARPDVLRALIDEVNKTGRNYTILIGPRVGRTSYQQQFAFIFDQAKIETDPGTAYTVADPDDLLECPPFVGWFRARGPAPEKAFTFTLVNIRTSRQDTDFETRQLDNVFYAVRDDDRGEDDLIMLGNFNVDDRQIEALSNIPGLLAAIAATATNTHQTAQLDNLVFQLSATSEYAGRSGVFDFMRRYNLTLEQALQVSDHLPVWAEFSTYEGGGQTHVIATQDTAFRR